MSSLFQYIGQEWCNPKNINLKASGYVTTGTPDGLMVLCAVEKHTTISEHGLSESQVIKYIPLRYEDLNVIEV